jgi:hypothetical protein
MLRLPAVGLGAGPKLPCPRKPRPCATALEREAADPEPQHITNGLMLAEATRSGEISARAAFFCPWNWFHTRLVGWGLPTRSSESDFDSGGR